MALDTGVPVGFGVLTCDDEAQALDRAGLPGSHEDKGREAAEAALRWPDAADVKRPALRGPPGSPADSALPSVVRPAASVGMAHAADRNGRPPLAGR